MHKVVVLLAVYNGRKWIDEQLESILNQTAIYLHVYISVDISTDDSYSYLTNKYGSIPNVTILSYGERFGSAGRNFYRLIKDVPLELYDYICFADQDDIWLQNKIEHAISIMEIHNAQAYSSNVIAFWENGKQCLINKAQQQVEYDYLFEAAGPGCTYVYSKEVGVAFKNFILVESFAQTVELHDWLLYAFCRKNNFKWYIDRNTLMLYRQHEMNQVGANNSFRGWKKRIKLIRNSWYKNEVTKLSKLFIDETDYVRQNLVSGYKGSFKLSLNVSKLRRRSRDRIILKILLMLNLF